ncbi:MAG: FkbM family methyltransferase [Pirellulaceae bacterium]
MSATETTQQTTSPRARGLSIPFVVGPLRGNWWQLASGGKIARLLLGTYEPEQSGLFGSHIRPGDEVLDIGAAAGYYTLLSAKLVGTSGRVVSFEPDPNNLQFLRSHVEQNGLSQVTILPIALADETGTAPFGGGTGTGTGRLCENGVVQVAVRRLDDIAAEMDLRPQHLKIDVEGAEMAVLRGGQRLIEEHKPTIFLSTHEKIVPGIHRQCCELLIQWGYQLQPITGTSVEEASELLGVAK